MPPTETAKQSIANSTPKRPVAPKAAASLILLRGSGAETAVLMGRRHANARFMPGVYVFPGGAVDVGDAGVNVASGLDPRMTAGLKVFGNPRQARALAIASIRETFEETGLMLGASGEVGEVESETWDSWRQEGIAPDLSRLHLVGRAITPITFSIRFNARFFYANGQALRGRIRSNGELEEIGWKPLGDVHRLRLPDVQRFMLGHLQKLLLHESVRPGVPLFSHRLGKRYVRYQLSK